MDLAVWIALGSLVLNFVAVLVGGTWALSRSNQKLYMQVDAKFDTERKALTEDLARMESRFMSEVDSVTRNFGETAAAMRTKMNDMELWNRDNLVSKGTFTMVISRIEDSWKRFEDKVDRRFDKLDERLSPGHGGK